MPAVDYSLVKRSNFASREPGVILVFCIIGAIGILIIFLYFYKRNQAKKEAEKAGEDSARKHRASGR